MPVRQPPFKGSVKRLRLSVPEVAEAQEQASEGHQKLDTILQRLRRRNGHTEAPKPTPDWMRQPRSQGVPARKQKAVPLAAADRAKTPPLPEQPATEVLLARSGRPRLVTATPPDKPPTVCVMGLHGSGTHALIAYLNRFFAVDTEPKKTKKDDGTLDLGGQCRIWKHSVPLGPFRLPGCGSEGGPVVVLLTIREVRSWMGSLSKNPYEIFPVMRRKRAQGAVAWMLEEVTMRTGQSYCNPFKDENFESVPKLWASYAAGYFSGTMESQLPKGSLGAAMPRPKFVVVRFEDLVSRPKDVVNALAELGLPRNTAPFEPIEDSLCGSGSRRSELEAALSRSSGAADPFATDPALLAMLREQLRPHRRLLEWLDYSEP